jgi:hypothetical protein
MTIVGIIYQYFTVTNTVLSVCLAAVLTYRLIQWRYDVQVRSLGGYGARIPTWAPFGKSLSPHLHVLLRALQSLDAGVPQQLYRPCSSW